MPRLTTLKPRIGSVSGRLQLAAAQQRRRSGRWLMAFKDCFFRQNPLCAMCKAEGRLSPATELDHKVPLFRGGKDFDEDPGQAQGLCAECHKNKTAQDLGYRQKREIGADGWPVAQ